MFGFPSHDREDMAIELLKDEQYSPMEVLDSLKTATFIICKAGIAVAKTKYENPNKYT